VYPGPPLTTYASSRPVQTEEGGSFALCLRSLDDQCDDTEHQEERTESGHCPFAVKLQSRPRLLEIDGARLVHHIVRVWMERAIVDESNEGTSGYPEPLMPIGGIRKGFAMAAHP
jgi:hypothetical protein